MSLHFQRLLVKDWMIFGALALALVLLSGVASVWGASLFVCGVGFWLLLNPPRQAPHLWVNVACLALLGWTLLQLMPGLAPDVDWRSSLANAGLLSSPSSPAISSYVQVLAFAWIAVALCWLFVGLNLQDLTDRTGRFQSLVGFISVLTVLSAAGFLMHSAGHKYFFAADSQVFTFLPNRNHMALLSAMGGVAAFALGYDTILRKPSQGILFFSASVVCLMAVLSLTSRAALLLYGFGLGMWLLASLQRSNFADRFKIVIPMGFLLLAVLFAVGQVTATRLASAFGDPLSAREAEGRIAIYTDSWQMFPSVWISGTGWNGFEPVFSHHRAASLSHMGIAHPESDWLWLWIEGGLPGLLSVVGGIAILTALILWGSRRFERYRRIAAICLLMALVHGFVDVPLHNAAVFLFLVWLLRIALPTTCPDATTRALFLPPAIWRVGGVLAIAFGVAMLYAHTTQRPWFLDTVEAVSLNMLTGERSGLSVNEVDSWLEEAGKRFPFLWTVHTNQARRALAEGDISTARDAFRRARNARGDAGVVTFTEARIWAPLSKADALDAYRETFLERRMYDQVPRFRAVLNNARQDSTLYAGLGRISRDDLELRQTFLFAWNDAVAQREMRHELGRYPRLERWPDDQVASLLWRVGELLGWRTLTSHFSTDPEWAEAYLPLHALAEEISTDWESGGALLVQHVTPASFPAYGRGEPISRLELAYRRSPNDIASALAYLRTQVDLHNWDKVEEICRNYHAPRGVSYPSLMLYWRARALYELNRGREGDRYWRAYIRHLIQSGALPVKDA